MDDGQHEWWDPSLGSKAVDDGRIELMHVGKVEIETVAMPEPFGAQGTLVEAACGVEKKGVVLEVVVTGRGEGAV